MGPGHNSVLFRKNKEKYLVCHIRTQRFCENSAGPGRLQIRKMYMTPGGWPFLSAEPYRPEAMNRVRDEVICGMYERIELRPSVPQGIMHSHPMELFDDGGVLICSVRGRWERLDDFTIEITYGEIREYIHMEKGVDTENDKTTVILSGMTSQGICIWAKKKSYL